LRAGYSHIDIEEPLVLRVPSPAVAINVSVATQFIASPVYAVSAGIGVTVRVIETQRHLPPPNVNL